MVGRCENVQKKRKEARRTRREGAIKDSYNTRNEEDAKIKG
jgi:hypothetical protein